MAKFSQVAHDNNKDLMKGDFYELPLVSFAEMVKTLLTSPALQPPPLDKVEPGLADPHLLDAVRANIAYYHFISL